MKELRFSRFLRSVIGLVAVFVLVLTGNPTGAQQEMAAPKPIDVGMVALLAAPENYEGKFIRTHGFLCIEFEGDAVYLHEEDYRHGLTKSSFALRLTKYCCSELR